jgi:hypothetical protein
MKFVRDCCENQSLIDFMSLCKLLCIEDRISLLLDNALSRKVHISREFYHRRDRQSIMMIQKLELVLTENSKMQNATFMNEILRLDRLILNDHSFNFRFADLLRNMIISNLELECFVIDISD